MTVRMLRRIAAIFSVFALATAPAAWADCEAPIAIPGVREPAAVSTFMTGIPRENGALGTSRLSCLNCTDIASRLKTIAIAGSRAFDTAVAANGRAEREVSGRYVSASYFDVLGDRLARGAVPGGEREVPRSRVPRLRADHLRVTIASAT